MCGTQHFERIENSENYLEPTTGSEHPVNIIDDCGGPNGVQDIYTFNAIVSGKRAFPRSFVVLCHSYLNLLRETTYTNLVQIPYTELSNQLRNVAIHYRKTRDENNLQALQDIIPGSSDQERFERLLKDWPPENTNQMIQRILRNVVIEDTSVDRLQILLSRTNGQTDQEKLRNLLGYKPGQQGWSQQLQEKLRETQLEYTLIEKLQILLRRTPGTTDKEKLRKILADWPTPEDRDEKIERMVSETRLEYTPADKLQRLLDSRIFLGVSQPTNQPLAFYITISYLSTLTLQSILNS